MLEGVNQDADEQVREVFLKKLKELRDKYAKTVDDTRTDTIPKAIGLAKFADEHGDEFGHLVIARKKGDKWETADMSDKATRENTKKLKPQSDLENLFG